MTGEDFEVNMTDEICEVQARIELWNQKIWKYKNEQKIYVINFSSGSNYRKH